MENDYPAFTEKTKRLCYCHPATAVWSIIRASTLITHIIALEHFPFKFSVGAHEADGEDNGEGNNKPLPHPPRPPISIPSDRGYDRGGGAPFVSAGFELVAKCQASVLLTDKKETFWGLFCYLVIFAQAAYVALNI